VLQAAGTPHPLPGGCSSSRMQGVVVFVRNWYQCRGW
jgi:hypothetical protein